MTSVSRHPETSNTEPRTLAQDIPTRTQDEATSSTPLEMNNLEASNAIGVPMSQQETNEDHDNIHLRYGPVRTDTTTALQQSQDPPPPLPSIPAEMHRTISTAIGPSSDLLMSAPKDMENTGPTLAITLLLTNGARHPFKLDERYLSKRNVQAQGNDPYNLSVYKLKELILREWREEWESKPSSPSAIRLISFGKLLDDKTAIKGTRQLNELKTPNGTDKSNRSQVQP